MEKVIYEYDKKSNLKDVSEILALVRKKYKTAKLIIRK
jgi:hypothetical protein